MWSGFFEAKCEGIELNQIETCKETEDTKKTRLAKDPSGPSASEDMACCKAVVVACGDSETAAIIDRAVNTVTLLHGQGGDR